MFDWFRDRRRAALRARPFPREWEECVRANVAHYCVLDDAERAELRAMIQVLLEEKQWEGCGGLVLTDEIRVVIAAQACLLLLCRSHNYYRNVQSILVYPTTVVPPEQNAGVFEQITAPVHGPVPLMGQAFVLGPVILVWDAVLHGARHPEHGQNVVYHEFAHKLDMLDGAADGTPLFADRDLFDEWVAVCSREYLRLRHLAESGGKTFLDTYGATNEAEFFAVATEEFFDRPPHAPGACPRPVPRSQRLLQPGPGRARQSNLSAAGVTGNVKRACRICRPCELIACGEDQSL